MANDALWRTPGWFPELTSSVLAALAGYHRELLKFNPRINLISRGTEREADEIHVADGILAARAMSLDRLDGDVHDFGSGNGVPGLIFAILRPATVVHLVESDSRKVEFLKHVIHTLKLTNARPVCTRVETLPPDSCPTIVNRGFASIARTLHAAKSLVPLGGVVFHLKGSGFEAELGELTAAQGVEWKNEVVGTYRLPVSSAPRTIVASHRR